MKNSIKALIVLLTFNSNVMAMKTIEIEKEIVVNVAANELWEMIGPGFVDVYKWSSNVDHAEGSGTPEFEGAVCSERFCDVNVKGFSKISEKLTKYDPENMVLAYEVLEGMPGFVTKAQNEWTLVPINETQTTFKMKAILQTKGLMGAMMGGMMEKKMSQTLETVLNDGKVYAETGKPSAAKLARIAELEKKSKKAA